MATVYRVMRACLAKPMSYMAEYIQKQSESTQRSLLISVRLKRRIRLCNPNRFLVSFIILEGTPEAGQTRI